MTDRPLTTDLHPVAMTVAGSDSGGGAGIQADLRAFSFFNVFGTTVITAVTAQNPTTVADVHPLPQAAVQAQYHAIRDAFTVRAAKTGMLFSSALIETVAGLALECPATPWVMDPVMVATSGARLLQADAIEALRSGLLPLASVITPNLPEAEILCGHSLESPEEIERAAGQLCERYNCAVLLKGGHRTVNPGVDIACDAEGLWRLESPMVAAASDHGTGCALSAAIAACLARGDSVLDAMVRAKAFVYGSLRNCLRVGPDTWAMASPAELPTLEIQCTRL